MSKIRNASDISLNAFGQNIALSRMVALKIGQNCAWSRTVTSEIGRTVLGPISIYLTGYIVRFYLSCGFS